MSETKEIVEARTADAGTGAPPSTRTIDVQRPALAVASIAVAALVTRIAINRLPHRLQGKTTLIGYPTYSDFNVNRYFDTFHLVIVLLPLVACALYFGARTLSRATGVHLPPLTVPAPVARRHPRASRNHDSASQLGRTLVVGSVLGVEVAIAVNHNPAFVGPFVVFCYCIIVAAGAYAGVRFSKGSRSGALAHRAAVNAAAVPLTIAGLGLVSSATGVRIASTGALHHFPWFSDGLAVLFAVACAVWIAVQLVRAGSESELSRIERRATVYVAAPTGLFLLTASISGALGRFDVFHEGEALGAGHLVSTGHFPWRDFAFIHGPLYDIYRAIIGERVLEQSRWGAASGELLILIPLYWVGIYFLATRVLRRNWVGLVAVVFYAAAGISIPMIHIRFMLWPIVILALGWMLDRPTWPRCAAFVFTLTLSVALAPETVYGIAACAPAVVGFDLISYRRGMGLAAMTRTWRCIVAGVVTSSLWLGYLAINGALGHYIGDLLAFRADHAITGGIPVQWDGSNMFGVSVYLPVLAILVTIWYFVARAGRLRELDSTDGMMAAAGLMTALYYGKFLARADGHVYSTVAAAIPLLMILAAKGLDWAEDRTQNTVIARRTTRHVVTALIIPLLFIEPGSILGRVHHIHEFFQPGAATEPIEPRIGYATAAAFPEDTLRDLRSLLATLTTPKEKIFDFTNEPGLFHYLLDYQPATRYYHVSMAIARESQLHLVSELQKSRPRFVVYDEPDFGLPDWDLLTNAVRHYEVSQYLLDHYKPLLLLHGFVIMVRNDIDPATLPPPPQDLTVQPTYNDVYFHTRTCDWGYTPTFLDLHVKTADALDLPIIDASNGDVHVALPPSTRLTDYRWMEIDSPTALPRFKLQVRPSELPNDEFHRITFGSAGHGEKSIRAQVGACPVWHATSSSSSLTIHSGRPVTISRVRLLR